MELNACKRLTKFSKDATMNPIMIKAILKSKPYIATYHGTSLCSFCNQQDETEPHLFSTCIKLQSVLNFFMRLIFRFAGYSLPSLSLNFCLFFDFSFLTAQHCHSQLI